MDFRQKKLILNSGTLNFVRAAKSPAPVIKSVINLRSVLSIFPPIQAFLRKGGRGHVFRHQNTTCGTTALINYQSKYTTLSENSQLRKEAQLTASRQPLKPYLPCCHSEGRRKVLIRYRAVMDVYSLHHGRVFFNRIPQAQA